MPNEPYKYKTHVEPHLEVIKNWRIAQVSIEQCCEALGISKASWYKFEKLHPEFKEIVHASKLKASAAIVSAVAKKAMGFVVREVIKDADGNILQIKEKELPPDTTAAKYLLNNLLPEQFRERKEIDHNIKEVPQFIVGLTGEDDVIEIEAEIIDDNHLEGEQSKRGEL